jgi:hypothetical protein
VKNIVLPTWLVKAIVTTIVSALLTGAGAWGVNLSSHSGDHEKRIAVIEDHQKGIDQSLRDIKEVQKTESEDIKKILSHLRR